MGHARMVALVVLCVLVGGCTPGPAPPAAPTGVTVARTVAVNPQDPDDLRDGGLFRIPLTSLPRQWNPWLPAGDILDAHRVRDPLAPQYFRYDAAGRPTPNPDYLLQAAVRHDPATVVTLTLNPDAVWGDGAPLTATDWIATWTALTKQRPALAVAQGWTGVADVTQGTSPHEVVITFKGVQPDWTQLVAVGPARADRISAGDAFTTGWTEPRPELFAGPFVVEHVDATQGVLTLGRNPRWWGEGPRLASVVFRTIQPQALPAAYQSNEFDIYEVGLYARGQEQARTAPDSTIRVSPGTRGRQLRLARTKGPLAQLAVRQAVVRAIDRERLTAAALQGVVPEPALWSNHLLLANQPGYTNQADATGLVYNRAAAADALTAAGWPLQDGRRVKDGETLRLRVAVDPADPRSRAESSSLRSDLEAVGIVVETVARDADLTAVTVPVARYPFADLGDLYGRHSPIAEFVPLIATEPDDDARLRLATQAARRLWQEADTLPLYQEPQVVAVKSALANIGAGGFASTDWADVEWAR